MQETTTITSKVGTKLLFGMSKEVLVSISIGVTLIVIGGIYLVVAKNNIVSDKIDESNTVKESTTVTSSVTPPAETVLIDKSVAIVSQDWQGKYIQATLPLEWKIKEFVDGKGSKNLATATYKGLTAVQIINDKNEIVFDIQAVYGIGTQDTCPEIYKFADTDPNYIVEQQKISKLYSFNTSIVDFSKTNYKSLSIFNNRVRRVNKRLYWNVSLKQNNFNAECSGSAGIISNSGLSFIQGKKKMTDYKFSMKKLSISLNDLAVLDDVLGSLKVLK